VSQLDHRTQLDYEQTLETYRQLTEIRFKLLAYVPTLTGAAVALMTKARHLDGWSRASFAAYGFLATLGVLLYERRNTQLYDVSIDRAKHLETHPLLAHEGDLGLFGSRDSPPRRRLWALPVAHGLGLALVYAPTLGAWGFAALYRREGGHHWLPPLVGAAIAVATFVQLRWRDPEA
jgi:hypothetical protein